MANVSSLRDRAFIQLDFDWALPHIQTRHKFCAKVYESNWWCVAKIVRRYFSLAVVTVVLYPSIYEFLNHMFAIYFA